MTIIWTIVEMVAAFCAWAFFDVSAELCVAGGLLLWGVGGIPCLAVDAIINEATGKDS